MPTHQSDIIAAKNNRNLSEKAAMDGDKTGALVLHATAVYTVKGTEVSNDIIELTDLPPSATVIPEHSYMAFGYPTAFYYGSLSLGDKAAPARYGRATIESGMPNHNSRFGYWPGDPISVPQPYDEPTRLVAKFHGSPSSLVAGGKIVFGIAYRVRG